ncbi:MAG: cell wall metabolism sensor histidine kinase WalK [Clostridia bacterium]|nr:cell wall metabolism sensor histidine kinase WalK [Clostridia bacterium]
MIIVLNIQKAGDSIEINTYQKDGKCVIEVKDTGIGISDEAISHVFERFYREDKARSRETGGSGLGLSIADMIISAHSGTIKASHNGNKGTVFTIKLPR